MQMFIAAGLNAKQWRDAEFEKSYGPNSILPGNFTP